VKAALWTARLCVLLFSVLTLWAFYRLYWAPFWVFLALLVAAVVCDHCFWWSAHTSDRDGVKTLWDRHRENLHSLQMR
jgi:hypothetical protein